MTVRSSFHLRGRHLIPGWNDPNFLNSPPLCRRICQSWFYFCKDFPRDPRQARDHTGSWPDSKMFFLVLFLPKTRRGPIGRPEFSNISAASAASQTADSSLLRPQKFFPHPSQDGGGREQLGSALQWQCPRLTDHLKNFIGPAFQIEVTPSASHSSPSCPRYAASDKRWVTGADATLSI